MSDIQLFSFQPREAPQPMPLRETPPGKVGPASLPREIFLQIAELLMGDVFGPETPATWMLGYCSDGPSKLVIQKERRTIAETTHSQMLRFERSRLPSQIDSKTRLMVHKKLIRITMLTENETISLVDAWVRPDIDRFVPYCLSNQKDLRVKYLYQEVRFRRALTFPTPACDSLIKCIQRIHLHTIWYINEAEAAVVAAFATFPHLEHITAVVATLVPDRSEGIVHHGIRKINRTMSSTLHTWAGCHDTEPDFPSILRPLKDHGVKLLVCMKMGDNPVLEICDTEKGIRIKNLNANCNCCSQDELY